MTPEYADVCRTLRRHRDTCLGLWMLVFFGRSAWAWISGRSWIVDPELAGLYVLGLPTMFALLGGRDLTAWLRLWRERHLAAVQARAADPRRPTWHYLAAGALLGASSLLGALTIIRHL